MIPRKRYDLVLAIYPQSRGFAFVLCEGWLAPVDWGITRRAPRVKELNARIAELADLRGIIVRQYSRAEVIEYFADFGASTKQKIAETIAKQIPALSLYVPPARKPWMSEDPRTGIFEAAALAWMYFHDVEEGRHAA